MKTVRDAAVLLAFLGIVFLPPPLRAEQPWLLKAPTSSELVWRGVLPSEGGAVGSGPQMGPYPAFGVAGLLVAVATHAAINQGVQSAQRKREQDDADLVLQPYLPALRAWPATALWEAVVLASPGTAPLRLTQGAAAAEFAPSIEVAPVFTMAQDENVLIADVGVRVIETVGAAPIEVAVRIVSSPLAVSDTREHWSKDDAEALKAAAARMVAHAITVTRTQGRSAESSQPMRSHRYLHGSVQRVERAQLVSGDCSRALLRTLRGALMSVPLPLPLETPCPRTEAF